MKVLIHIGTNKTGTSSLQDFFVRNAGPLLRAGWIYPEAGRDGEAAHHAIAEAMQERPARLAEIAAEAAAEAKAACAGGMILSSEALHAAPAVPRLAQAFEGHDVQVVVFLRDYIDYLSSWYREDVQTTNLCCDFSNYAVLKRKNYFPVLKAWAQAFGDKALHICAYDREHLLNKSMIDEVLIGILGIPDLEGWDHIGWDQNPSISGNLLFLKRLVNNFISRQTSAEIRSEIVELSKIDPAFRSSMAITSDFVSYIHGQYQGDRRKISEQFGFDLPLRVGARKGAAGPDMDRLETDYQMVLAAARERGYRFAGLLETYAPAFLEK